jgi:hypothetical protein
MFHAYVANVLSGCCIFNEIFECSKRHETNVVVGSFLCFNLIMINNFLTFFDIADIDFFMLRMLSFDVVDAVCTSFEVRT